MHAEITQSVFTSRWYLLCCQSQLSYSLSLQNWSEHSVEIQWGIEKLKLQVSSVFTNDHLFITWLIFCKVYTQSCMAVLYLKLHALNYFELTYDERGERKIEGWGRGGGGAIEEAERQFKLYYSVLFSIVVHLYGQKVISKPQKKGTGQLGYQNEVIQ